VAGEDGAEAAQDRGPGLGHCVLLHLSAGPPGGPRGPALFGFQVQVCDVGFGELLEDCRVHGGLLCCGCRLPGGVWFVSTRVIGRD